MYRIILIFFLVTAGGCNLPKDVLLSDPSLKPFLEAIEKVDRVSLGFTPIEPTSRVRIETKARAGYDAMLHIYGSTRRTIAFRRNENGYVWTGEQEIHTGPGTYPTQDGPSPETLVITYETEHTDPDATGSPLREVHITYHGTDRRLTGLPSLALKDVMVILSEWKEKRSRR
jgi:hypothetical protein